MKPDQLKVLNVLAALSKDFPPSLTEISKASGQSVPMVRRNLIALAASGFVQRKEFQSRGSRITEAGLRWLESSGSSAIVGTGTPGEDRSIRV